MKRKRSSTPKAPSSAATSPDRPATQAISLLGVPSSLRYVPPVTEAPPFLEPIHRAHPRVRAAWLGRIPGVPVLAPRDAAMQALRPTHQAAILAFTHAHPPQWWRAEQVHGHHVALAPAAPQTTAPDGLPAIPGADGLITRQPGLILTIYVADCAAIWLADRRTGAIGLLHSGRKGTDENILGNAVHLMHHHFGTLPADLTAVLSPCIRPPHYEIDFARTIATQARNAGITDFHDHGANTACDLAQFYSYRLEKGQTGRMMALITLDPPPP